MSFALSVAAQARGQKAAEPSSAQPNSQQGRRIILSIPDRKLALMENGRVVKIYRVAVGAKRTPSPVGEFQLINRITDPTWYGEGRPVPPGPKNPLGTRWMGISKKGYGIHGTNAPRSVGRAASHGCIRMAKGDVEELFEQVGVGDTVEFHSRRTPELAAIFAETPAPPAKPVALPASQPGAVLVAAVLPGNF